MKHSAEVKLTLLFDRIDHGLAEISAGKLALRDPLTGTLVVEIDGRQSRERIEITGFDNGVMQFETIDKQEKG